MSADSRALAFVVQRYGKEVTGGSETLARSLAQRLAPEFDVTVFTTCARDYVTWRNELPPGPSDEEGVQVLRFPVQEERDLAAFNRYSDELYARPHTVEEEMEWLRRQGPYAPELVLELQRRHAGFRAVLFFTYLYYPTCLGLKAAPARSILVPTAHDEPPLGLSIYREVFRLPRAFAFLTVPEAELVRARFDLGDRPCQVAGMGVDLPAAPDVEAFRRDHGLRSQPYLLYAGRIDSGKGCQEMVDNYQLYRDQASGPLPLLLIGQLNMEVPEVKGVEYLGYLPEVEKRAAIAGARAVICPSPYESLSIVLLEAMAAGVPALVNGRSEVLRDHCVRSNGGLYYESAEEFAAVLELLQRDRGLREALSEAGRRYVRENYRWEAVLEKYRRLIRAVSG
ncbi:MAG TPA: glycosyltransferase family 4 protein [Vicinamibacteria bacterium]|nr:glycosyltransferase family 4 protein [Vicinamibacteria bacterium]